MQTFALSGAKNLGFFEISAGVSAWTKGLSQYADFVDKGEGSIFRGSHLWTTL